VGTTLLDVHAALIRSSTAAILAGPAPSGQDAIS
jgi:hypothetical protein